MTARVRSILNSILDGGPIFIWGLGGLWARRAAHTTHSLGVKGLAAKRLSTVEPDTSGRTR